MQPHDTTYDSRRKTFIETTFWSRVDRLGSDDCWLWLGPKHKNGYGFDRDKRYFGQYYPHRVAYIFTHGAIPTGLHVLHKCDTPLCCNPLHLFAGTNLDNIDDKIAKGRQPRGEKHGIAKLTPEQVVEIRQRYSQGGIFMRELAEQYGVKYATVSAIIRRKNWQWLE